MIVARPDDGSDVTVKAHSWLSTITPRELTWGDTDRVLPATSTEETADAERSWAGVPRVMTSDLSAFSFLYCIFKIYSSTRLSSRKFVINSMFSVHVQAAGAESDMLSATRSCVSSANLW